MQQILVPLQWASQRWSNLCGQCTWCSQRMALKALQRGPPFQMMKAQACAWTEHVNKMCSSFWMLEFCKVLLSRSFFLFAILCSMQVVVCSNTCGIWWWCICIWSSLDCESPSVFWSNMTNLYILFLLWAEGRLHCTFQVQCLRVQVAGQVLLRWSWKGQSLQSLYGCSDKLTRLYTPGVSLKLVIINIFQLNGTFCWELVPYDFYWLFCLQNHYFLSHLWCILGGSVWIWNEEQHLVVHWEPNSLCHLLACQIEFNTQWTDIECSFL